MGLGVAGRISFLGAVYTDLTHVIGDADVFVLPGLGGLAICEAMRAGLPVICSRADGTEHDFVVDGVTGYRIDSDDDDEVIEFLVDRVAHLERPALVAEMGGKAQDRAIGDLGPQQMIKGLSDAIRFAYNHG